MFGRLAQVVCVVLLPRSVAGHQARRQVYRASYNGSRPTSTSTEESNKAVLDAFYIGRAFAQTLNERLGAALGDFLSEIAKADAERQRALRDFQEEVVRRAEADMLRANSTPASTAAPVASAGRPAAYTAALDRRPDDTRRATITPPPDLQETVDDLRAEVATTRAALQQLKAQNPSQASQIM